jgi:ribosomal protein S18 acetylase RimI-like enzyme
VRSDNLCLRGGRAMIAIDDFQRVGAAWYRLFRRDRPGYAFLDESTPELAIAVVPSRRGRGFGHELLSALVAQAREDGFGALSLSVDRGNPSVSLYRSYGFETVEDEDGASTMRAQLA